MNTFNVANFYENLERMKRSFTNKKQNACNIYILGY